MVETRDAEYPYWRSNLLTACIGCFIIEVSFTVVTPLLPILLEQLGTARDLSLWSGIVFSGAFLASAVMAPVWGSLSDRFGKRIMLIRAGFAIAATYGLTAFATNHWQVVWLRVANGALSGYVPAATMLVAANTPDSELGFALGVLQTTTAVGTITGPLVGGVLAQVLGLRGAFLVGAAMPAVASLLAVWGVRETRISRGRPATILGDVRAVLSNRSLRGVFAVHMISRAGALAVQPTLPLLVGQLVQTNVPLATGVVFSLFGLSTALAAPLVSRVKRCNCVTMLTYGLFGAAALAALQGIARSIVSLSALRFAFGLPGAAVTVAINVLAARSAPPEERGRAFGVMNSVSSAGAVLGPMVGGLLGGRFGVRSSFFGCAGLYALAAVAAVASYRLLSATRPEGDARVRVRAVSS